MVWKLLVIRMYFGHMMLNKSGAHTLRMFPAPLRALDRRQMAGLARVSSPEVVTSPQLMIASPVITMTARSPHLRTNHQPAGRLYYNKCMLLCYHNWPLTHTISIVNAYTSPIKYEQYSDWNIYLKQLCYVYRFTKRQMVCESYYAPVASVLKVTGWYSHGLMTGANVMQTNNFISSLHFGTEFYIIIIIFHKIFALHFCPMWW